MILLESRLDQVVLYPQSARLTYLLSDTLSTEQATLILPEVGGEVDWTSLQACVVEGTGRVEVIRRVPPTARAREQSELWARRRTLLEEQFRQVEALGMVLLARPQPKPSESSDKKHSLEVMREGRRALLEAEELVNRKLAELDLQLQEGAPSGPEDSRLPGIAVHLSGCRGAVRVELSFLSMSAGWKPHYELALDGKIGKKGCFRFLAEIRQQTGQDWNQVQLVLSNAAPSVQTQLPQLDSFLYRPAPPAPLEDFRQVLHDASLYSDYLEYSKGDRGMALPDSYLSRNESATRATRASLPRTGQGRARRKIFQCPECDEVFIDQESMEQHRRISHLSTTMVSEPQEMRKPPERITGMQQGARGMDYSAGACMSPRVTAPAQVAPRPPAPIIVDYDLLRLPGPEHHGRGQLSGQGAVSPNTASCDQILRRYPLNSRQNLPQAIRAQLLVAEHSVEPAYQFMVTPERDLQVYAECRLANPFLQGLEAGPLVLYEGNAFLRSSRLERSEAGRELEVGLGGVPFFEVTRQQRQREQKGKQDRRGLKVSTHLAITSTFPDEVQLWVRETLPRLEGEGCELNLLGTEPAAERSGLHLTWQLTLIPGECQNLEYNYRIGYPEKNRLQWSVR